MVYMDYTAIAIDFSASASTRLLVSFTGKSGTYRQLMHKVTQSPCHQVGGITHPAWPGNRKLIPPILYFPSTPISAALTQPSTAWSAVNLK